MDQEISKSYEPAEVERRWYSEWERRGYFAPGSGGARGRFSIVIPPPNVTGSLHIGHAFCFTLHDVYVRWKRMKGFDTLWLPGTDHAGIATQNVVEKALLQEGVSRKDMGREAFTARVWEWKGKYGSQIVAQLRRLGVSCDWERLRFTMDDGLSRAVREVFVRLYEEGLIYKGEYIVNWCPRCETAISDLETVYETLESRLYYIKYPVKGCGCHVTVATTRPETMLGDTAVAVNPGDERFLGLAGKTVLLPVLGREIPVIADGAVAVDFGTGAVKVTPSHDPNDFAMGRRHGLAFVRVIDTQGRMTGEAGPYAGLDRFECRSRLVDDLRSAGLLEKTEPHTHNVGHCQRCGSVVEPLASEQWFVKVRPLADMAVDAVKRGLTRFFPDRYEKTFFTWMADLHDWCISRQLWWGHRIPAWLCGGCGRHTVARETPLQCAHCGSPAISQEEDVLDTWFSSALWPFSTMGWPDETPDLKRFYPTDLLITGYDIIFFWVSRMIMAGMKFMGDAPFRTVYIHGLVRDEQNQKMSKSKGNSVDPLEIMDRYGTDAVRFTLSVMALPGNDLPFKVDRMLGYRAFVNKIWNAARFLIMKLPENAPATSDEGIRSLLADGEGRVRVEDRWILHRCNEVVFTVNASLEQYLFHEAADSLYHFFWHEFCDWYIELAKPRLDAAQDGGAAAQVLLHVLDRSLKLMHPFMPFITEEIWQKLPHRGDSIMLAAFPEPDPAFAHPESAELVSLFQEVVVALRTIRSENGVQPGTKLPLLYVPCDESSRGAMALFHDSIRLLAGAEPVREVAVLPDEAGALRGSVRGVQLQLTVRSTVDPSAERERLGKEIRKLAEESAKIAGKLENPEFLAKAHPDVVEKNRGKMREITGKASLLEEALARITPPGGAGA